ncbi:MAG: hypothetical protein QG650_1179 [Patescibacteria group bacterium]|nr:hypothetical protein [Patescibacteria group bacterium]
MGCRNRRRGSVFDDSDEIRTRGIIGVSVDFDTRRFVSEKRRVREDERSGRKNGGSGRGVRKPRSGTRIRRYADVRYGKGGSRNEIEKEVVTVEEPVTVGIEGSGANENGFRADGERSVVRGSRNVVPVPENAVGRIGYRSIEKMVSDRDSGSSVARGNHAVAIPGKIIREPSGVLRQVGYRRTIGFGRRSRNRHESGRKSRYRDAVGIHTRGERCDERTDVDIRAARGNRQLANVAATPGIVEFEVLYRVRRESGRDGKNGDRRQGGKGDLKESGDFHIREDYFVIRNTARLGEDMPETSMMFIAYDHSGIFAGIRTMATVSSTARKEAFLITRLLDNWTETIFENPRPWRVT